MRLYRVAQRWSNDKIALTAGDVYELTPGEVAQVDADCPGSLAELTAAEVDRLIAPLRVEHLVPGSFRPGAPDRSGQGRGAGDAAMSSANMAALVRR